MSKDLTFEEFAYSHINDFFDYQQVVNKHNKEVEIKANELAESKAGQLLNQKKEEFQLAVLKQLQSEGIKEEGAKLSSASPLITETYMLNGVELFPADFIPDSVVTDPLYEETVLVKNQHNFEIQEVNTQTGKRKFVWKETPTLVLICNPVGIGKCENIAVYLKGRKRPLIFKNGEISEEGSRRQTTFARKGINVSVKRHFESFLRSLRECPNKKFLTIPKHSGGVTLPSGITIYISAESVIPGLEELFPEEVIEHKMVAHELPFKDTVEIYRKALPNCLEAALATTVRIESILLLSFKAEGLKPDRSFSISYTNDSVRETAIALTKRKNYTTTVVQSLSDRITKVRKELVSANDTTVIITYSGIFEEGKSLDNALKEISWDITGANGDEDNTRKIIIIINDRPERIPDEYPVYYINCGDDIIPNNVYEKGLPVDLLDLRGCLTLKDERERLLRIYAIMTRMLGSYQEQILKIAVNCMLRCMKRNNDVKFADIIEFIEDISYNEDGELDMDEAHRKLFLKLKSVIEDLDDTPVHNYNWSEFTEAQHKPIIVLSTGADSVGKGSEIIDMLIESIYTFKQCHPDSEYTVIIDEAQDLYLHEKGAVNTLLRKGGKHGVTMLLASQSYPDPNTPFGKVVGNCGRVRGYRSKGDDLARYADRFGCDKHEADTLQKGNCFDNGPFYSRYRCENVITTLMGRTVAFESAPVGNDSVTADDIPDNYIGTLR